MRTTSNGGGVCTDRPRTVRRSIEREPLRGLWAIEQAQRAAAVRVTGRKAVRRKRNPLPRGVLCSFERLKRSEQGRRNEGGRKGRGETSGGPPPTGLPPLLSHGGQAHERKFLPAIQSGT